MKATKAIILELTDIELNVLCAAMHQHVENLFERVEDDNYTTTEEMAEAAETMYCQLSELRSSSL